MSVEADEEARYVIVGGGMAADAAVRGIRREDPSGSILLLTEEPHPPYDRPPLSKGLWEGEDEARVWRGTTELEVDVRTGTRVEALDPEGRRLRDREGRRYGYRRLLLATGGRPRRLKGDDPGVLYFRTLEDFRALRVRSRGKDRAAILGGGFIACELASSFLRNGVRPVLFFPEEGPLGRTIPPPFSRLLSRRLDEAGARLLPETFVTGTREEGDGVRLVPEEGELSDPFPVVVAGLGILPNEELAAGAGLEVSDGIVVDEALRTSVPGVWAAGDVARCPFPFLGGLHRVEHEDHANESGMWAGKSMAGGDASYDAVPYYYSRILDLSLEVLGTLDGEGDPELHPPRDPIGPGAAVLRTGRGVRGVLLWNVQGRMPRLRRLLRSSPDAPSREVLETIGLK